MAKILDGTALSNKIKNRLKTEVDELVKKNQAKPHLAVILVGDDF